MAKRIVWSPEAISDRIQILDYWYKRLGTKGYSKKLDEMFKESVALISEFPFLGRKVKNREERVYIKDYYQIHYLVQENSIEILQIWDSRS